MGNRAFSLVEMLVCIAVAAMLYGLIVPTTAAIRGAAGRHQSRVRFNQWRLAIEEFRTEYGHLPDVATGGRLDPGKMLAALTGCDSKGSPVPAEDLQGNIRRIRFHAFGAGELILVTGTMHGAELVDGNGNSQIGVLIDRDEDGAIHGSEVVAVPVASGNSRDGFTAPFTQPASAVGPGVSIPARIAFYSTGSGRDPEGFVYSWR